MNKAKKYMLIGAGIFAVSAGLFFWLRGKGKSKLDK